MRKFLTILLLNLLAFLSVAQQKGFRLNDQEYFENGGVNVMAFQDIYPEGHQGGVAVIMHGIRIATNGDIRLDETPGQWQPIPKQKKRTVSKDDQLITAWLTYPDSSINGKGFNPVFYPDLHFNYSVKTRAAGNSIVVSVDLDRPVPKEFLGKVGFIMELYPGALFGKSWYLDGQNGIFPRQPNGPGMTDAKGELVAAQPMATGKRFVAAPEDNKLSLAIESRKGDIQLIDGRYTHNNGWFVLRTVLAPEETKNAVEWVITPHVVEGWIADPVVHVSQVGYHPDQSKTALIELDKNDPQRFPVELIRISESGPVQVVLSEKVKEWGPFLRYNYLPFNFTSVRKPGIYQVKFGRFLSQPFRIDATVYGRHVWQPTLEYFLPVQMCHMRINEKYRVWHGLCHMDDARMAPLSHNHFDGYLQGDTTFTRFKSGEVVPGLNTGGWHDAGDYDLRVESQSGEVYILTNTWEAFRPDYDETMVDQHNHLVEIHQPDGLPDILQQIEHGVLSVVGGYQNLGRLYRGIIDPTIRQYVLLGDGVNLSDGLFYDPVLPFGEKTATHSSLTDDRWVFTEDNPGRELAVAAHLAAASRALKGFNDTLSLRSLEVAELIFHLDRKLNERQLSSKIQAAAELLKTTGKKEYRDFILGNEQQIVREFRNMGWIAGQVVKEVNQPAFTTAIKEAALRYAGEVKKQAEETPFGVPYRPHIWGAGWDIQSFGVRHYYLHSIWPDIFPADYFLNALNFVLGVHPGVNTSSFASGVGSRSATVAYGINRADWSYIPGGVVSGTALIRPDFPELLDWPFLWQQQEYVMGGGATNFMFLALAAEQMFRGK